VNPLSLNPLSFYKALADETRLRCLLLLAQEQQGEGAAEGLSEGLSAGRGELCVCELMAALQESQPKVSRHLAQLRNSGLLLDRRQGQWVFYRLDPALPQWALDVLHATAAANGDFLQWNRQNLQSMGERPERAAGCC